MANLIQIIKQAAIEAVEASAPVKVMYGTVSGISPISVKLDQKFIVPDAFIVVTDTVSGKLSKGDRVVILREQGGQRYIILDKVV